MRSTKAGESKGVSEKHNDSNTHLTNAVTSKIHDTLPKPQPKAHVFQMLFNIIQVQKDRKHWTASLLELMAVEFNVHGRNA